MDKFRNAVKACIINNKNEVLLLKRRKNDPTRPDTWDVPGGRLELGENPINGIQREVKEETNLEIKIIHPLGIHHFTRDDGQNITMIVFYCNPLSSDIKLCEENQEYQWFEISKAKELLHNNFTPDFEAFEKYFQK